MKTDGSSSLFCRAFNVVIWRGRVALVVMNPRIGKGISHSDGTTRMVSAKQMVATQGVLATEMNLTSRFIRAPRLSSLTLLRGLYFVPGKCTGESRLLTRLFFGEANCAYC